MFEGQFFFDKQCCQHAIQVMNFELLRVVPPKKKKQKKNNVTNLTFLILESSYVHIFSDK